MVEILPSIDAHNDDRVAEERKRQFEVPQRGANDGWWGGAHVASGHALFSYPTRVQVCKMESGTRTWANWFGTLGLLIPFSGVTWHVLEPGAFHKSSMAMKHPPKTSSNESHLKSTTYEWQWHPVYVLHISIVQTMSRGFFWGVTAKTFRPDREEQKAAMTLRHFLAQKVCGLEVFDKLLTLRLQVAMSLKQVANLMIYECRWALFNWYIEDFPKCLASFLVYYRQPMDCSLGWQ